MSNRLKISRDLRRDSLLTSQQVANLLQVDRGSINNWVRDGYLDSYKTPGGHNRIQVADLLRFLRAHNMAVPSELAGMTTPRVLVVVEKSTAGSWKRKLSGMDDVDSRMADNKVSALIEIGAFRPDLVIWDAALSAVEACKELQQTANAGKLTVLIVADEVDGRLESKATRAGAAACYSKMIPRTELSEWINTAKRSR